MDGLLNGALRQQQMQVRCGMVPMPAPAGAGAFKAVYTDATGAVLAIVDIYAPAAQVVGPIIADLAQRLSKQLVAAPGALAEAFKQERPAA